jgi:phage gpG-like protein
MPTYVCEVQADAVQQALEGLLHGLRSQVGWLRQQALPMLREWTDENFEGEHAPDGTPWHPLKDSYLARKLRDYGRGRIETADILQRKRELRRSLASRNAAGSVQETGRDGADAFLRYGTDVPQGLYQLNPHTPRRTDGPGGRVPERRFLGITEGQARELVDADAEFLFQCMRGER